MNNSTKKKRGNTCRNFFGKLRNGIGKIGWAIGMLIVYPISIVTSARKISTITKDRRRLWKNDSEFYARYLERESNPCSIYSGETYPRIPAIQRTKLLLEDYKITDEIYLSIAGHYNYRGFFLVLACGVIVTTASNPLFFGIVTYCLVSGSALLSRVSPNKINFFNLVSQILPQTCSEKIVPYAYDLPLKKLLEEQFQNNINKPFSKEYKEMLESENYAAIQKTISDKISPDIFDLYYQKTKLELEFKALGEKRIKIIETILNRNKLSEGPKTMVYQFLWSTEEYKTFELYKRYRR